MAHHPDVVNLLLSGTSMSYAYMIWLHITVDTATNLPVMDVVWDVFGIGRIHPCTGFVH